MGFFKFLSLHVAKKAIRHRKITGDGIIKGFILSSFFSGLRRK